MLFLSLALVAGLEQGCEKGHWDSEWVNYGAISPETAIAAATKASTIDEFRIPLGLERTSEASTDSVLVASWVFIASRESRSSNCRDPDVVKVSHSVIEISASFRNRRKTSCIVKQRLFMTGELTLDPINDRVSPLPFGAREFGCSRSSENRPAKP